MPGPYCYYCDRRCFVTRHLPADATSWAGSSLLLATCPAGMDHDRALTGHDHETALNPAARVFVLSWVYWNDDEQGGGGFDWLYDLDDALEAFDVERFRWAGETYRIRLVPILLPGGIPLPDRALNTPLADERRAAVTAYIDSILDDVEDHRQTRAVRVAISPPRAA